MVYYTLFFLNLIHTAGIGYACVSTHRLHHTEQERPKGQEAWFTDFINLQKYDLTFLKSLVRFALALLDLIEIERRVFCCTKHKSITDQT